MYMEFPWKTTGIVLTAPLSNEVDATVRLIDEYLAPRGFNMIVLQVRYRYQFKKHPEVWGYDPLSYEDVKALLAVCKKHNIKLVPKMKQTALILYGIYIFLTVAQTVALLFCGLPLYDASANAFAFSSSRDAAAYRHTGSP